VPHLGNIVGSVLSADVFSGESGVAAFMFPSMLTLIKYNKARDDQRCTLRHRRIRNATETRRLEEGVTHESCDKYAAVHADIYSWFDIGFDIFGRSSTQQQEDIVQASFAVFIRRLHRPAYVQAAVLREAQGVSRRSLHEGTCPKCGYEDARGDQCDKWAASTTSRSI